ncbi:MAG: hypothetical protein A3J85_07040 [Desulfobacula sp. RIFOXYA12_FULL_46_16]|nr:MAG: hypothetical protein A2464_05505 [Deltaproteobacteria bacterium RIFOXYC2_FULL_48_10]OGR21477.1 MAG: hypothetical protein A3J85_07040 [Desulfobacula sp. RIFOXYA12_FULL_46_16]OGR58671.1 MAG: hypothetical protein A3J80_08670 [Desulfobacula sp. RIFOXYB2_FULL_45_6]
MSYPFLHLFSGHYYSFADEKRYCVDYATIIPPTQYDPKKPAILEIMGITGQWSGKLAPQG